MTLSLPTAMVEKYIVLYGMTADSVNSSPERDSTGHWPHCLQLYCHSAWSTTLQRTGVFKLEHFETDEDYEKSVSPSYSFKTEWHMWMNNVHIRNGKPPTSMLSLEDFQQDLYPKKGLRMCTCSAWEDHASCSGQWSVNKAQEHINYLELEAILFGLLCFRDLLSQSVCIHCDNTSPVASSYVKFLVAVITNISMNWVKSYGFGVLTKTSTSWQSSRKPELRIQSLTLYRGT